MADSRALEGLLRRRRMLVVGALAVLCALAWAYLLNGAGLGMSPLDMTRLSFFPHRAAAAMPGMDMPDMRMGGMDMSPPAWTLAVWALTVGMWWSMMIAMMAPTAAPTILLYGRVRQHADGQGQAAGLASSGAFTAGYLLIWLGFSLAAAALQWALEHGAFVSATTMGSQSRWLSAGVLAAAGLYQLSPLQDRCLSHCRSPAVFLSRHWRPGALGAIRLGVMHGAYCVGCCWLLMGLLFVGGVMNLVWIAALTLLVLAEKVLPGGVWVGRGAGVALLAWSAATLVV